MLSSIHPADDAVTIDKRGAGKLRGVLHARRTPVLPEACGFVRLAPLAQRTIGKQSPQIVLLQSHRSVRTFLRIREAEPGIPETRTKRASEIGRAYHHEAHGDTRGCNLTFDLAQLRERFPEERSADVAQPDDERRQRNTQVGHLGR